MIAPLDPFSEVVDERRRIRPDWYSWLSGLETAQVSASHLEVTPYDFGATGDGVEDDTSAVEDALATGNHVNLAEGTFRVTGPLVMQTGQWMRMGTLIKDHTGDMLDMTAEQCALFRVVLNCNDMAGRGVIIDSTGTIQRQFMGRTFIGPSVGPALEFTEDGAGFLFTCEDCAFSRTTSTDYGVKLPIDTDGGFGGRWFYNCHNGGNRLIDLGGSKGTRIFGGSSTGIAWSEANCQYSFVIGHRLAFISTINGDGHTLHSNLVGNTMNINGTGHNIGPNIHDGGALVVGDGTTGCTIFVADSSFTDNNSPAEPTNKIFGWLDAPVATWRSNGTQPAIGNGTVVTKATSEGKLKRLSMKLTLGSTSTIGTGAYFFTFAAPWNFFPQGTDVVGTALYVDDTGGYHNGIAILFNSVHEIYIVPADGTGNFWGSNNPVVPAQNDEIHFDLVFSP